MSSNGKILSIAGPGIVAVLALTIAVLATGNETALPGETGASASSPVSPGTPYSADHARIQSAPTDQPATF
jgi:hypothetical protein